MFMVPCEEEYLRMIQKWIRSYEMLCKSDHYMYVMSNRHVIPVGV